MDKYNKLIYKSLERDAIGNETLNVTSSVAKLNPPVEARYALIYVESDVVSGYAIRYWEDGSDPTNSEGIPRHPDTAFDLDGFENLMRFRATEAQVGTHTLQVQYYN